MNCLARPPTSSIPVFETIVLIGLKVPKLESITITQILDNPEKAIFDKNHLPANCELELVKNENKNSKQT